MTWKDLPLAPTDKMLRQFGGLCFVFFGVLAAMRWHKREDALGAGLLVGGAAIGGVLGWLRPRWLRPIFVGWTVAVFPIGFVVSKVVMAVAFFLVLTPLALVMRMTGRDALALKRPANATSYWSEKTQASDPKRYLSQY